MTASGQLLLELTRKGLTREEAYQITQPLAMRVWDEGGTFKEKVQSDPDIQKTLAAADVDHVFNSHRLITNVDRIFERVFKQ